METILRDEEVVMLLVKSPEFKNVCTKINGYPEEIRTKKNFWIASLTISDYKVMLDKDFDIVAIFKEKLDDIDLMDIWYRYKNDKLSYPLNGYTLKDIYKITNKYETHVSNHGHRLRIVEKDTREEIPDGENKDNMSYVLFMRKLLDWYSVNYIRMNQLGVPLPNLNDYINKEIELLNQFMESCLGDCKFPKTINPADVAHYLGISLDDEIILCLYSIIGLYNKEYKDETYEMATSSANLLQLIKNNPTKVENKMV